MADDQKATSARGARLRLAGKAVATLVLAGITVLFVRSLLLFVGPWLIAAGAGCACLWHLGAAALDDYEQEVRGG